MLSLPKQHCPHLFFARGHTDRPLSVQPVQHRNSMRTKETAPSAGRLLDCDCYIINCVEFIGAKGTLMLNKDNLSYLSIFSFGLENKYIFKGSVMFCMYFGSVCILLLTSMFYGTKSQLNLSASVYGH